MAHVCAKCELHLLRTRWRLGRWLLLKTDSLRKKRTSYGREVAGRRISAEDHHHMVRKSPVAESQPRTMVIAFVVVYVVGQLSSRTRHRVLAVAALDKSLRMVWWRWHISVSQLCCCWSMAVPFWVTSITVCVYFGVPPWESRSLNYSRERTLNFSLNLERVEKKSERCWCKFTDIMLWRKQQFACGWNVFRREDKVSLMKRVQGGQQQAKLKKTLQKFVNLCVKIVGLLSVA